ncbi:MAG: aldehyde dehydrogenase family protein, partial [Propionibacteriales bacterium]|nr:aldehyde dehydrogenase family protein [Propionibacteriales bacterium]
MAAVAYSRYCSAMPSTTSPISAARVAELTKIIHTTTSETRTTISPFTGQPVAQIPVSSIDDVESAFNLARAAQQDWAQTSLRERSRALLRLHDLVLDHQAELLDLIQIESGKTRADAFDEVAHLALTARFYARRLKSQLKP